MKKFDCFVYLLLFALSAVSCSEKEDIPGPRPAPEVDRTILVYMAADNSLSPDAYDNVSEMIEGMRTLNGNLIVYFDPADSNPQLIRINNNGTKTVVEQYPEENSSSPKVLSRVIARTASLYPAKSYGLILWSHGFGWIPSGQGAKARSATNAALWQQKDPDALPTKWFGQDWTSGSYMEIPDLAACLPQNRSFDFILFDACFMASIEALYDLRQAAEYIIASPTEILAFGFPYSKVVPLFFTTALDLESICRQFVNHYETSRYPAATISLVKTRELDALAASMRTLMGTSLSKEISVDGIQYYENMNPHLYFDLEEYASRLTSGAAFDQFKAQLARAVVYAGHTPQFYSAYSGSQSHWIDIRTFSGLSSYIPQSILSETNADYRNTAWAKAIGATD